MCVENVKLYLCVCVCVYSEWLPFDGNIDKKNWKIIHISLHIYISILLDNSLS